MDSCKIHVRQLKFYCPTLKVLLPFEELRVLVIYFKWRHYRTLKSSVCPDDGIVKKINVRFYVRDLLYVVWSGRPTKNFFPHRSVRGERRSTIFPRNSQRCTPKDLRLPTLRERCPNSRIHLRECIGICRCRCRFPSCCGTIGPAQR